MDIMVDNNDCKISIDDIREYILEDYPCFLIEKIVGCVDFSEWEEAH